jgi:pimeloyl-ACP methyl ester carboxylesterase
MRARIAMLLVVLVWCPVVEARAPRGLFEHFRVKTDNVPQADIDAWYLPAKSPKGTVFLLHGYNNNKEFMVGWEWIRDREDWNVVMFDFREHGASSHSFHLSTIGYYEIWDVKAVVDWADRRGLARPFVIYGRSMGAATGLRWASMDRRITGVLAVSPFKNAELATREMADYGLRLAAADKLQLSAGARVVVGELTGGHLASFLDRDAPLLEGVRKMLREVDIPSALRRRDDLRVWIMAGEHDSFGPAEQREIIEASASPAELKRLVIAPGVNHHTVWTFKGTADVPSHDRFVREFLASSVGGSAGEAGSWTVVALVGVVGGAMVVGVIAVFVFRRSQAKILGRA